MLLGLVGFAMIFLVVYLLISGKVSPMVIFVAVPFVAALICGFTPAQIFEFMKKGGYDDHEYGRPFPLFHRLLQHHE